MMKWIAPKNAEKYPLQCNYGVSLNVVTTLNGHQKTDPRLRRERNNEENPKCPLNLQYILVAKEPIVFTDRLQD